MIRDKKWILGAYVYVFLFDISFLSHLGILEISIFIKNQESGPLVDIKSKFDYFLSAHILYVDKKVNPEWWQLNSVLSNKQWNVK